MSGLDVDLIQRDTTESAMLYVDTEAETLTGMYTRGSFQALHGDKLRARPAHFSLCTFLPLPSPTKLNLP